MTGIRKGMWVKYKGKLGIANSIDGDTAEVHLVDERGLTTLVIPAAAVASPPQQRSSRPQSRSAFSKPAGAVTCRAPTQSHGGPSGARGPPPSIDTG